MPAYNFKHEFIPMILEHRKQTTIRRIRTQRPTVKGDDLMLYWGMRTKGCTKIADGVCVETLPMIIHPFDNLVYLQDTPDPLEGKRLENFVIVDGFDTVDSFFDFFKLYKTRILDDFELIRWNPRTLKPAPEIYEKFPEFRGE